tara:strand:+ start:1085 stop:1390 length:306 start_codon:yes stop_codon:yes gene_type:complete
MNKKVVISLLIIILLLTILCLKITLVEFFSSRENIEQEVRNIFKNCPAINNINTNDLNLNSISMSDLTKFDENTISEITDCYDNLSLKDQSKLMSLFINFV